MDTFLNFIKKSWKILLFVVIIIHVSLILADFNNFFHGKFVADWLGYFGSLIGAAISIYGIYWTLQDSRKQLEEQREEERRKVEEQQRKEIFPFISLSNTRFGKQIEELSEYVDDDGNALSVSSPEDGKKLTCVRFLEDDDYGEDFYISFDLENIGLAAGFIKKVEVREDNQLLYSTEKVPKYSDVILVTSSPEQVKQIIFKTELGDILEEKVLVFDCYYEDLLQNEYLLQKYVEISEFDYDYYKIDGLRDRRPELISK